MNTPAARPRFLLAYYDMLTRRTLCESDSLAEVYAEIIEHLDSTYEKLSILERVKGGLVKTLAVIQHYEDPSDEEDQS